MICQILPDVTTINGILGERVTKNNISFANLMPLRFACFEARLLKQKCSKAESGCWPVSLQIAWSSPTIGLPYPGPGPKICPPSPHTWWRGTADKYSASARTRVRPKSSSTGKELAQLLRPCHMHIQDKLMIQLSAPSGEVCDFVKPEAMLSLQHVRCLTLLMPQGLAWLAMGAEANSAVAKRLRRCEPAS